MSKLNLLVHLNAYEDENPTNNPSRNNFKWNRDSQGIDIDEPCSKSIVLEAGQSQSLFAGQVTTSDDATTTWDIALKSGTTNTYRISRNAGTLPGFRTLRAIGSDATTEVTVTKNAKLLTFTATGGTLYDLDAASVEVGDIVRIGAAFNVANQGKYTILAKTTNSFTVENNTGLAEGPILLDASFEDELKIHSQDGVQVGDRVDITAGFSVVSQNTYEITDVADDYIEFFSLDSLPAETEVANSPAALFIYRNAKNFIYIESDQKLQITLDTTETITIEPLTAGTSKKPGVFMSSAIIRSAEIKNLSQSPARVFYTTAE